ncbi:tripartite tricarboxylate transporter substrate binding protein [Mycobacterium sp. KBS0706]|uniref:Bug family tripartite tricarboxylate transporter substrate binding protein n=1 Tax=Mycobacterium sp. KBS0706 TaxID=2578109 RepID=UPI00110FA6D3|nr:tripartite tricarboxylate transporter substrate binding protein [Mycobacterium sp. KBS0706]TSD86371.1 tripartite tricarboxylate transporter substrate binding protein [Mycobacterium sp. KBS0706]
MTTLHGLVRRTVLLAGLAACFALPGGMATAADAFPSRTVTLVVPFAAGGSTDLIARIIAEKMTEDLGQTVIVENKAGAGGNIGADAVAKADPDGYTILMGTIATHALNPAVMKQMPYDPVKDFAPISLLVLVPNVLEVNPELPVKSVQELIALLKSKPGEYSYASSGIGTPLHLSGELFKSLAGVDMIHVPYRGAGPALNDVVANQVPIMFDNLPSSTAFIKAGTLRPLAVTTKTRSASFPDLPTMEEAGVPGYETYTWNAIFAPAGTPQAVIDRLNAAAVKAVKDPATQPRLAELSATVVGSTPDELAKHVTAELAKWAPIVEASGAADSQ